MMGSVPIYLCRSLLEKVFKSKDAENSSQTSVLEDCKLVSDGRHLSGFCSIKEPLEVM